MQHTLSKSKLRMIDCEQSFQWVDRLLVCLVCLACLLLSLILQGPSPLREETWHCSNAWLLLRQSLSKHAASVTCTQLSVVAAQDLADLLTARGLLCKWSKSARLTQHKLRSSNFLSHARRPSAR